MKNKKLFLILLIACIMRLTWVLLGWNTNFVEAYNNNISIVYQRAAYLISFGYGYMQADPGSPAYEKLSGEMENILRNEKYDTNIPLNGLYRFQQYPPGLSLLAALLFMATHIPIPYILQAVAICIDLITISILYFFMLGFFDLTIVFISLLLYAVYPPVLALSASMTPDSWMIFFISLMLVFFFRFIKNAQNRISDLVFFGLANGVCALFRPDLLLLPFFISLSLLVNNTPKKIRTIFKINVVVYACTFLILLPWGLYNKKESGNFLVTSSALGGTLVTGLASFYNPMQLGPSDIDRREEAKAAGIAYPFEAEGDKYFRGKFTEYVNAYPVYYAKTILYRSALFVASPYLWGLEHSQKKSFSTLSNEGKLSSSIQIIISEYFVNIISACISLLGNLALFIIFLSRKNREIFSVFICIWIGIYLSHIWIHLTPNYVMPLLFIQVFSLVYFIKNFKQFNFIFFRNAKKAAALHKFQ